ncbi:hypothetical protein PAPYR_7158 [Paratrimastix pyriformis]|uniref:Uncharacterized protein n=1 Tax=Paratrimastix pyriformis TaxID=342808 RepID=A0ABQ8UHJ0_9EUKA|nr:hypothetical protein PAPYR_7158 [Paratrimastix pyriformis]
MGDTEIAVFKLKLAEAEHHLHADSQYISDLYAKKGSQPVGQASPASGAPESPGKPPLSKSMQALLEKHRLSAPPNPPTVAFLSPLSVAPKATYHFDFGDITTAPLIQPPTSPAPPPPRAVSPPRYTQARPPPMVSPKAIFPLPVRITSPSRSPLRGRPTSPLTRLRPVVTVPLPPSSPLGPAPSSSPSPYAPRAILSASPMGSSPSVSTPRVTSTSIGLAGLVSPRPSSPYLSPFPGSSPRQPPPPPPAVAAIPRVGSATASPWVPSTRVGLSPRAGAAAAAGKAFIMASAAASLVTARRPMYPTLIPAPSSPAPAPPPQSSTLLPSAITRLPTTPPSPRRPGSPLSKPRPRSDSTVSTGSSSLEVVPGMTTGERSTMGDVSGGWYPTGGGEMTPFFRRRSSSGDGGVVMVEEIRATSISTAGRPPAPDPGAPALVLPTLQSPLPSAPPARPNRPSAAPEPTPQHQDVESSLKRTPRALRTGNSSFDSFDHCLGKGSKWFLGIDARVHVMI